MGSKLSQFSDNANADVVTELDEDDDCFQDAEDADADKTTKNNENIRTDAVESRRANYIPVSPITSNITCETVKDIEQELSFYEKVSLQFLLQEQADQALQSLLIEKENLRCGSTINIIFNWAKSEQKQENNWQNKFIEALSIIQNYTILERLGYKKKDIIETYLPTVPYTSYHVNMIRKVLYCVCELLTFENIKLFLHILKQDFKAKNISFIEFDDIYLEMYLLHCFSMNYIKNNDFSNIISIFKKLGLEAPIEILESVVLLNNRITATLSNIDSNQIVTERLIRNNNEGVCKFRLNSKVTNNNEENNCIKNCSDQSVIGNNSIVKIVTTGDTYPIDSENVGICLIINQYKFYEETDPELQLSSKLRKLNGESPLKNRDGTEFDRIKLSDTFKMLGFRIEVRENLTHKQIIPTLQEVMTSFTAKDSCFVVCILSHGQKNTIYGVNSIPVEISNIENTMHDVSFRTLAGKPKVLIIQSCQGKVCQTVYHSNDAIVADGVETSSEHFNKIYFEMGVPEKRDLLVLMSTIAGYASVRHKETGTWFIQELCKAIVDHCETKHLLDIMTIVTNIVSNKRWHMKNSQIVTVVPESKSSLSKNLYLKKIPTNLQRPINII